MSEKWNLTKDVSREANYLSALNSLISDKKEKVELKGIPADFSPLKRSLEQNSSLIIELLRNILQGIQIKSYENILLKGEIINKIIIRLLEKNDDKHWKELITKTIKNLESRKSTEEDRLVFITIINIMEANLDKSQRKLALLDPICINFSY